MPDWIIIGLTFIMIIALGLITWTWRQAWLNFRAAREADLKRFARIKLLRESILWTVQGSATTVYTLAVVFPQPRNEVISAVIVFLLLAMSVGVALLSWHDYAEMRVFFDD